MKAQNVPDRVHLRGIGIDPAGAVADHRVRFPRTFPQLVGDFDELLSNRVTLVVRDLAIAADDVAGRAVEQGSDDVPADPAPGEMVERAELAGQQVWRLVRGGYRDAEAEPLGGGGHRRDGQQRIGDRRLHRPRQRRAGVTAEDVQLADRVGDEQGVETT